MTALATLLGAGVGLGVVVVLAGWRGIPSAPRAGPPRVVAWWRAWPHANSRLALAVGVGVLVGAGTGWPVAALLAAAGALVLPGWLTEAKTQAATTAKVEAIAGWAEMLRDTMAGAAGLHQAIQATATTAPAPIRPQVLELAARLERERLPAALRAFADDVADPTGDLVVAALLLAAQHEARRLGDLLGSLAAAARDQASMRLRVEAGRARTRTSVRIIIGVTIGLALLLAVLNRGYLAPYDTATGQLVLLVVGGLFAASFGWLARITRPAASARLLRAGRQAPR